MTLLLNMTSQTQQARITSKDKARANIGIIPKDVKLIIVSTKKDKEIKQKEMANLKRVGL